MIPDAEMMSHEFETVSYEICWQDFVLRSFGNLTHTHKTFRGKRFLNFEGLGQQVRWGRFSVHLRTPVCPS